ncbi:hypothetical protein E2C01_081849 [Portunus trituberculatus]|uniref:Uncharacterized protein n=1 Tax=Portunus trituberculatus TaxID=210409 RepID=A0A5B7INF3_PORTR|nr:hypothetical protein [Portunus trituberculatus]
MQPNQARPARGITPNMFPLQADPNQLGGVLAWASNHDLHVPTVSLAEMMKENYYKDLICTILVTSLIT